MKIFSWFFKNKKVDEKTVKLNKLTSKLKKHGITQSTILLVFKVILEEVLSFENKPSDLLYNKKFELNLGDFVFSDVYVSYDELYCHFYEIDSNEIKRTLLSFTFDMENREFVEKNKEFIFQDSRGITDELCMFIVRLFSTQFRFVGREILDKKSEIERTVSKIKESSNKYLENNEIQFLETVPDKIKVWLDEIQISNKVDIVEKRTEALKQLKTTERLLLFLEKKIEKKENQTTSKKTNVNFH